MKMRGTIHNAKIGINTTGFQLSNYFRIIKRCDDDVSIVFSGQVCFKRNDRDTVYLRILQLNTVINKGQ